MALGAAPGHLRRMILRETLVLVSAGTVCGIPLALATGSALKSMLFGVKVQDAFTTVCCVAVLLAAGYVAGFFPARRAARLDPMAALRSE